MFHIRLTGFGMLVFSINVNLILWNKLVVVVTDGILLDLAS